MRNRIRKHCNAINAKGGEVNNKFKHSLATNRPEMLLDHAQVALHNSSYQGGAEMWSTDNNTSRKTRKKTGAFGKKILFYSRVLFIARLDSLEHNHELNRHSKL